MRKSEFVQTARRSQAQPRPSAASALLDVVEGQIVEICRDLALQVKRMRQLQEQADELRDAIGKWISPSGPIADRKAVNRAGPR